MSLLKLPMLSFQPALVRPLFKGNAILMYDICKFRRFNLFTSKISSCSSIQDSHKSSKELNTSSIENVIKLSRVDKPTGIWLLYFPCAWSTQFGSYASISTASSSLFWSPKLLCIFFIGAVLMRTAGCIVNDIWDRKIDRLVERTRSRPLASGTLSMPAAVALIGLCCSGGLGVLYLLPPPCAIIALGSVLPSVIYPFMKRVTYFPQVFLGVAFNWGALLGYPACLLSSASFLDPISISNVYPMLPVILPLYLGGIFWTLIYDTIYAHQDINDDFKVGVKSTAIRFGSRSKLILTLFSFCTIVCFNIAGWMNEQSGIYFFFVNVCLLPFLLWQVNRTNYTSPKNCWKMFSISPYFGLAFWAIVFLDSYCLSLTKKKQNSEY